MGDPAYEVAPFLYNPLDRVLRAPDPKATVARRIDHLAEHFDRSRIVAWALVQSVLSAWWQVEDHGSGYEAALRFADAVGSLTTERP